jgi:hypothetical protein
MPVNSRKKDRYVCVRNIRQKQQNAIFPREYPPRCRIVLIVVTHSISMASRADLAFTVNVSMLLQNVAVQL